MNGVLLVDKPAGLTSHSVISKLRRKLQIKKMGHAGTLDPTATGLLVVCIGNATKISSYVMDLDKVYQTRFCLGKVTTTYDTEGQIVSETDASKITEQDIRKELLKFQGDVLQKPPVYSAIKIAGKKLYEYARSNTEVEIPSRLVKIHEIKLLDYKNPLGVLEIHCSKGTYVRSIVHDLGQSLKVGASVETIHRTQSSPFSIENAVTLTDLLEMDLSEIKKKIISISNALEGKFFKIQVSSDEELKIRNGIKFPKKNIPNVDSLNSTSMILFVSKDNGQEIAIGQWSEDEYIEYKRIL